jgi:RNA polymerase sigma-70 factor (ECF subfamily)
MNAAQEAEFDALYRAHYSDLVAMAYALGGDLADAQDLVQEAFCRAWRRWDVVSGYDKPVAWVRRVAINLASSRWRQLRTARFHQRLERAADVPGLEPDHVALVAAMRTLPIPQRRAMVMYYVADMPVNDVAAELGVPPGTVKSMLHRARTALAALLTDRLEEVTGRD